MDKLTAKALASLGPDKNDAIPLHVLAWKVARRYRWRTSEAEEQLQVLVCASFATCTKFAVRHRRMNAYNITDRGLVALRAAKNANFRPVPDQIAIRGLVGTG